MPEPFVVDLNPPAGGGEQQPDSIPSAVAPDARTSDGLVAPPPSGAATKSTSRTGAGVGLLLAVTGAATGVALGGAWGGVAGLLFAGTARNAVRAYRSWSSEEEAARDEAKRSAVAAAFGGFLAIVASVQSNASKSKDDDA